MGTDSIAPMLELLREFGWTIDTDKPSSELKYKHAVYDDQEWSVLNAFDLAKNEIIFAYNFPFDKEVGELGIRFFNGLQDRMPPEIYLAWDEAGVIRISWSELYPDLSQIGAEDPEKVVDFLENMWLESDQFLYSIIEILRLYADGKAEPEVSGVTTLDFVDLCLQGTFPGPVITDA